MLQKINYSPPDDPADPESAALELIVRMPSDMLGHEWPDRAVAAGVHRPTVR